MRNFYGLLKTFSPLILVIFFSSFIITPGFCQGNSDYLISAPAAANKGDTFDLTIKYLKGTLDPKDVSLVLPNGFENTASPSVSQDGSLTYKIKAGQDEGTFNVSITVSSTSGAQTLSEPIEVQRSFWEAYQPILITVGILVVLAVVFGGMSKSTSGGSGGGGY